MLGQHIREYNNARSFVCQSRLVLIERYCAQRLFKNRAFGLTPFLVAYTLVQLVGHNTWESITKFRCVLLLTLLTDLAS